jgi:hypothetical protein
MICVDRKKRITAEKVLKHEWFKKVLSTPGSGKDATDEQHLASLDVDVIKRLR